MNEAALVRQRRRLSLLSPARNVVAPLRSPSHQYQSGNQDPALWGKSSTGCRASVSIKQLPAMADSGLHPPPRWRFRLCTLFFIVSNTEAVDRATCRGALVFFYFLTFPFFCCKEDALTSRETLQIKRLMKKKKKKKKTLNPSSSVDL